MRIFRRADKGSSPRRARAGARRDAAVAAITMSPPVDIAPNDPIIGYFQSATGAVDVDNLDLVSPGLTALQEAGVKLVVPLVTQGELIGLLNLGPRLSERDYSGDDRRLLDNLAAQVAPAVRVGQLVQEQEAQIRTRERLEQEMRVATLIQQQFLPKELPELSGWQVSAFYRPARAVGGDFYDFIELPEGKIALVAGDVTDKGVPAALVMASTRSIMRAEAQRLVSPAKVLERANDLLFPDIPGHMFVTCLYAVLDPATGTIQFANAGHNLPYVKTEDGVIELRATGMPLGLMPGSKYEEVEATLDPGQTMLLHSDGLAEAHSAEGEMFGFPRMHKLMAGVDGGQATIDKLLLELDHFTTGVDEQEDDITLVALQRADRAHFGTPETEDPARSDRPEVRILAEFTVPSNLGNEREVMDRVAMAVEDIGLTGPRRENLKTAVSEAAMNAIEHGNKGDAGLDVGVRVLVSPDDLRVLITDQGGDREIPESEAPDIEAKLAGLQTPRGWGLFLIQNMVDEMEVSSDEGGHTVELVLYLKGESDDHDDS
jgi:serine phosphatase RsbU (regulator of sigma subunit)/anti-sigma regulatory factor (Ser/Thr protein kinase)